MCVSEIWAMIMASFPAARRSAIEREEPARLELEVHVVAGGEFPAGPGLHDDGDAGFHRPHDVGDEAGGRMEVDAWMGTRRRAASQVTRRRRAARRRRSIAREREGVLP